MVGLPALIALGLLAAGCRGFEHDTGPFTSCDADELEPGRVRARRMPCDDEGIAGGEAQRADYLIDNAWVRFGVRHPGASLTLLGTGGGTVADAALPGGQDVLAELVPLVGDGWLADTSLSYEQAPEGAAIHVTGLPEPIGFLRERLHPVSSPDPVTVSYRLGPEDRALSIEGADGFWLVPLAGAELTGSTLRRDGTMFAVDGQSTDLGGGVLFTGGSRLAVGEPSEVMAALWPGGAEVSGSCECDGVEVLAADIPVGWLPVGGDGDFEGTLPAGADGLRALVAGHAPGPSVEPGQDLQLEAGVPGWLGVRVVDRYGQQLAAVAIATDGHGRRIELPVEPEGSWLALGAGDWDIEVDAGPLYTRGQHRLLGFQGSSELELTVDGPGPPDGWVLADLGVETWPSRNTREPVASVLARAAASGVGFAVVSAPDEVATTEDPQRPWDDRLLSEAGSQAVSADQGTVLAWPVSSNRRKPAHGAVPWDGLVAEDILRVAAGSSKQKRLLEVDADWVRAAGAHWGWEPWPDMVRLRSMDDLGVLTGLSDVWADVSPTGPLTWVRIGHSGPASAAEVERGLIEGHTVATTGPFLDLTVNGQGPGSALEPRQQHRVDLTVLAPRDLPLEGAALVVDGELWAQWDLDGGLEPVRLEVQRLAPSRRYILAVAWGPQEGPDAQWAITAPIWTGRP